MLATKYEANTEYYNRSFVIIADPKTGEILAMAGKQLKEEDGQLKVVKSFTCADRTDDILVEGKFIDSATISGTIYPTGTTFQETVSTPLDERTGTDIWENGTGTVRYEIGEDGYYNLIFRTMERNLANMDRIGSSMTRYVLEEGQLVIDEQWYEVK